MYKTYCITSWVERDFVMVYAGLSIRFKFLCCFNGCENK